MDASGSKAPVGAQGVGYKRLSDDPAVRLAECRGEHIEDDVFRTVPISLLAATCYAIQHQKEAPKLLERIRRYTLGDLSKSAFDERAELMKAKEEFDGHSDWQSFRDGWLACAKSRTEGK